MPVFSAHAEKRVCAVCVSGEGADDGIGIDLIFPEVHARFCEYAESAFKGVRGFACDVKSAGGRLPTSSLAFDIKPLRPGMYPPSTPKFSVNRLVAEHFQADGGVVAGCPRG